MIDESGIVGVPDPFPLKPGILASPHLISMDRIRSSGPLQCLWASWRCCLGPSRVVQRIFQCVCRTVSRRQCGESRSVDLKTMRWKGMTLYRRRNELDRIASCEVRWFSCYLRNYLWAEQAMKSKTRVSCENCVCCHEEAPCENFPPSVGPSLEDKRSFYHK